jgi:hypothetical protein
MKKLFVILIIGCFLYFVGGSILLWIDWLTKDQFLTIGGIVGSFASILGLFSLIRPAITRTDIQNIEIESLRKVVETSDEVQKLEQKRTMTRQDIKNLSLKKAEMEFLVRKASLALFLVEQRKLYERRIREELERNTEFNSNLMELGNIDEKINALNMEIEKDPNVELMRDIIRSATKRPPTIDEIFENVRSPLARILLLYVKTIQRILK